MAHIDQYYRNCSLELSPVIVGQRPSNLKRKERAKAYINHRIRNVWLSLRIRIEALHNFSSGTRRTPIMAVWTIIASHPKVIFQGFKFPHTVNGPSTYFNHLHRLFARNNCSPGIPHPIFSRSERNHGGPRIDRFSPELAQFWSCRWRRVDSFGLLQMASKYISVKLCMN